MQPMSFVVGILSLRSSLSTAGLFACEQARPSHRQHLALVGERHQRGVLHDLPLAQLALEYAARLLGAFIDRKAYLDPSWHFARAMLAGGHASTERKLFG